MLPSTGDAIAVAHSLTGVLCLSSAALHHGWAVKAPPPAPHVSQARGRGAARVRQIAGQARADAANAFESVVRSIALHVPGLNVEPQRLITSVQPWVRPDLVDEDLRLVIEADSVEWHGSRAALRRDCRRYDQLVVDDWLVLRIAWEGAMFDPAFVRQVLLEAVALAARRTKVRGA